MPPGDELAPYAGKFIGCSLVGILIALMMFCAILMGEI